MRIVRTIRWMFIVYRQVMSSRLQIIIDFCLAIFEPSIYWISIQTWSRTGNYKTVVADLSTGSLNPSPSDRNVPAKSLEEWMTRHRYFFASQKQNGNGWMLCLTFFDRTSEKCKWCASASIVRRHLRAMLQDDHVCNILNAIMIRRTSKFLLVFTNEPLNSISVWGSSSSGSPCLNLKTPLVDTDCMNSNKLKRLTYLV